MKISSVNTYFVRPRWGFVEIETDNGLVGWGEAVLEGHAKAVLACVQEMKDYLIGRDPSEIEGIWSTIYRAGFYRGGGVLMSAIAGATPSVSCPKARMRPSITAVACGLPRSWHNALNISPSGHFA